MKDYKSISFNELASYLSDLSDITNNTKVSLEMIEGKYVLTEKKNFSVKEIEFFLKKFLKEKNYNMVSFSTDEEYDQFFCEVYEQKSRRVVGNWLEKSIKEVIQKGEEDSLITIRLANFLKKIQKDFGENITLTEILENLKINSFKGYGKKTKTELFEFLERDLNIPKKYIEEFKNR